MEALVAGLPAAAGTDPLPELQQAEALAVGQAVSAPQSRLCCLWGDTES